MNIYLKQNLSNYIHHAYNASLYKNTSKRLKNYFAEDKMAIIGKSIYWCINKKKNLNKYQQQLKLIWRAIFLGDI